MKPDVPTQMQKSMAASLGVADHVNNSVVTPTLTPTTLRSITQLFESEDCLESLKKLDETGTLVTPTTAAPTTTTSMPPPALPVTISGPIVNGKTSFKSWQGGLTTVVTPTTVTEYSEESMSPVQQQQEPEQDQEQVTRAKRPMAVAVRKSARKVQPSSRYSPPSPASPSATVQKSTSKAVKRTGGRKPATYAHSDEYDELDPEEAKRLKMRRERNKQAAARCRRRRVDLTNRLSNEVQCWEEKNKRMEEEFRQLKAEKEELEFLLEAHSHSCQFNNSNVFIPRVQEQGLQQVPQLQQQQQQCQPQQQQQQQPQLTNMNMNMNLMVAVKSEPVLVERVEEQYRLPERLPMIKEENEFEDEQVQMPNAFQEVKPKRPMSLSLSVDNKIQEVEGISIDTPSSIIPGLAFDTVTTGFTPMLPNMPTVCFMGTPTLNTPTNCSSQKSTELVSL